MPRIAIYTLDDPRIAMYRSLKTTNLTRRLNQFVVEGEKLLEHLLKSRFALASVLTTDRFEPRLAGRIPDEAPVFVIPHAMINAVVGFRYHQGVLACGVRQPGPHLETIVEQCGANSTIVVCPTLNNPENLGAILRIADVFGVDAILVGGRCPDPLSRRVLRVSMGTALRLPVVATEQLERDVDRLRSRWAFERLAAVVDPTAEPLDRVVCADRLALFLGAESEGLEPEWVARCDREITIPMRPGAESLNVSVAAGILLYHFQRQLEKSEPQRTQRARREGETHR
jgi:tRNA G18 (ribose-2'-O)-methylase SpoU